MQRHTKLLASLALVVPLLAYVLTLCPTVFVGDSGELALAAERLEIAHPPGYPLLTLVGHLWTDIFFFLRPIVALNLFSAVCAAVTSLLTFLTMSVGINATRKRPVQSYGTSEVALAIIALVPGYLIAFGHTLWSVATSYEVYALSILLFSASLYCWVRFYFGGRSRWLLLGVYLIGLMMTHHFSALVLGVLGLTVLIARRRQLRVSTIAVAAFLLVMPLTLYGYMLIRSRFPLVLDWYNPEHWAGLKQLVLAQTYRQRFVTTPLAVDIGPYLHQIWILLTSEWIVPGLVLAVPGMLLTIRHKTALGIGLLLVAVFNIVLAFPYNIIDIETYYLPALVIVALWIGATLQWLAAGRSFWRWTAAVVALLVAATSVVNNHASCDLSNRRASESYARDLFASVPDNGWLFCSSDISMFPTLYLHYGEGVRPDMQVYGVLCTLPKLRRDLHIDTSTAFNSFPPALEYATEYSNHPLVFTREPMQFDYFLRMLPNLHLKQLVAYLESYQATPTPILSLDWQHPPRIYDEKEAVLYAEYNLIMAEQAEENEAYRWREQAAEIIERTGQPILMTALATYLVDVDQLGTAGRVCTKALNSPILRQRQELSLLLMQSKIALGTDDNWLAEKSLQKVLAIDPDNAEAKVLLLGMKADQDISQGDLDGAIDLYQKMVKLDPDQTKLYLRLGRLYLRTGRNDLAREMFLVCEQRGFELTEADSMLASDR